jgi:hypothetical protein
LFSCLQSRRSSGLPAVAAQRQRRRRRPRVSFGARAGKRTRLLFLSPCFSSHFGAMADLSVLFADASRDELIQKTALWKAVFTNRTYNILMQFFSFFTFQRIPPN